MVELRKRQAPSGAAAPPPAKKTATTKEKNSKKGAVEDTKTETAIPKAGKVQQGDTIDLNGFGGEVETDSGDKVTLAQLVEKSKAGVVLFTYPKANTPGCTTQACLFRDSYEPLTSTGLAIYGLSTDSPKSNTSFKTKYNFPYTLLCDPNVNLIQAIGLKKAPKNTVRGVFVVGKDGKVLAAEPGGPAATVDVVKKLVEDLGNDGASKDIEKVKEDVVDGDKGASEDVKAAETAAQVADTAAKVDGA